MESKTLSTLADGRRNSIRAQDSSKLDTLEKNLHRKRFSPEEKCYMAHHVNQCHDFQHLCRMFYLQFGTVRNLESIEKFLSKCDDKSAYPPKSASESTPSYSVVKASGSATLPKITNGTPYIVKGGADSSDPTTADLRLIRTCRQIYTETALLPYSLNRFIFQDDAVRKRFEKSARVGKKRAQKRAVGEYEFTSRAEFEAGEWQRPARA
ncbi:MAG: hypothetical protein Q9175_006140 [Cornicularia normoerica]